MRLPPCPPDCGLHWPTLWSRLWPPTVIRLPRWHWLPALEWGGDYYFGRWAYLYVGRWMICFGTAETIDAPRGEREA